MTEPFDVAKARSTIDAIYEANTLDGDTMTALSWLAEACDEIEALHVKVTLAEMVVKAAQQHIERWRHSRLHVCPGEVLPIDPTYRPSDTHGLSEAVDAYSSSFPPATTL